MTFELRRIVDLSHPINAETQVYPGDPVPELSPATTIDRDGYNVLHVSIGSQTRTTSTRPTTFSRTAHESTRWISRCSLALRRWSMCGARRALDDLLAAARAVRRGWSAGRSLLYHRLVPALALAGLPGPSLPRAGRRRRHCGGWCPNGGHRRDERRRNATGGRCAGHYVAHDVLLGAGGAIVENLTNLDAVDFDQALLSVLPIRLADADGAPVRPVALQLEWSVAELTVRRRQVLVHRKPATIALAGEYDRLALTHCLGTCAGFHVGDNVVNHYRRVAEHLKPDGGRDAAGDPEAVLADPSVPELPVRVYGLWRCGVV